MRPSLPVVLSIPIIASLASMPCLADKKKQNPEDGMVLEVSTKKKKKKDDEMTQVLPLPKEPPAAVIADTDRLAYQVSPMSAKGLLSQQTRDAMKALLHSNHGGTIVKLRAFVAGSGDTRRIQEIVGEVFDQAHQSLPALSVIQAGALPLEGAQVVIESTGVEKKPVNPNGVAFVSGQPASSVEQAIAQLTATLHAAGMEASDVLRATCFVSSLEESRNAPKVLQESFPGAAINYVQMQREPVRPVAECEGVARMRAPSAHPITCVNPPGAPDSAGLSQLVLVTAPKVVFTSTQLGFGSQDSDVKLAFDRLGKALGSVNARFANLAMSHVYLTSMSLAEKIRSVRNAFYSPTNPPATTLLPFEALPSLDASFGIDVVAVPDTAPHN